MKTENQLAAIVDRLGALKAAAAEIESESEALKGELIFAGMPAIDGGLFRATVSHCPGRELIDWKALALDLMSKTKPDLQKWIIEKFTTTGTPFTTVRVSARKGS